MTKMIDCKYVNLCDLDMREKHAFYRTRNKITQYKIKHADINKYGFTQ